MKRIILFTVIFLIAQFVSGQIISLDKTVVISGKVIDSQTNQPLEYATISLLRAGQDKIIGTTTDIYGAFKMDIDAGVYKIQIDFLSFQTFEIKSKLLTNDFNLGVVSLNIENTLEEVEVNATKNLLEFKINKKIYNASADIANIGGNALDVLGNTPSVRVDTEGTINVRGSTATILINGKPQFNINNNNDILKSLPSNSIDKVEIITRSAKYSADGGGAILNIITKRSKNSGLSGSFNAHTGIPDNHGFSTFLNKASEKLNLYATLSYVNENRIKETEVIQPLVGLFENIEEDRFRNTILLNVGSDFYINDKNTLSASVLFNSNNKNSNYLINEDDFTRNSTYSNDISKIEGNLGYVAEIDTLGQKLSFDFKYESTTSDTNDDIVETQNLSLIPILQKSNKEQQLTNFLAQLDYTLPLTKNTNLELGYRGTFRNYENKYNVGQFDTLLNDFTTIHNLDDTFVYDEDVHAFYGLYNATNDKLSYVIGLRSEITNVRMNEQNISTPITKKYTDFFPSLTMAYAINDDSNIALSYSRSIDRPSIPQLNPFISFTNERFQTIGNPNLDPYYSNYVELVFDKSFHKIVLASALFLNFKENQFLSVIENTGQLTSNGDQIFRRVHINSGDNNIIGMDLDVIYSPFKGLRLNGYFSPYRLEIANAINPIYNDVNTVWYAEGNALISLNTGLNFRVSHKYQSPIQYGPTKLRAINFTNITVSKDLLKKRATLTFKAIDVFRSKRFLYESLEANIKTNYNVFYQNQYSLSFSYRFNQKRKSSKDRSKDINKDDLEDKQDKKM